MGDGKKIRLLHDAWLPNSNAGRIIFHKGILAQTAKTNGLIDSNSGWWNLGLIDQCFYPPPPPRCSVHHSPTLLYHSSGRYLCLDCRMKWLLFSEVGGTKSFVRTSRLMVLKLTLLRLKGNFGRVCGNSKSQERSSTSYGSHALTHCLQRKI